MLRDKRLAFEARGALAMVLTYPANWSVRAAWLREQGGIGKDKAQAIVRELEAHGYCERRRPRTTNGELDGVEYLFTDLPGSPQPENPARHSRKNRLPVQPVPGNPPLQRTISYKRQKETKKKVARCIQSLLRLMVRLAIDYPSPPTCFRRSGPSTWRSRRLWSATKIGRPASASRTRAPTC